MAYFFYGEDIFSLNLELRKLKEEFAKRYGSSAVEVLEFDERADDGQTLNRLREIFESGSLFAQKKMVILRDFLSFADDFPKTNEYFLKTLGKTNLESEVVIIETLNFDKRKKLYKSLQKLTKVKEFTVPQGPELEDWIHEYLKAQSFSIDRDALLELITRLGENYDLWRLSSELQKLMLYAGSEQKIDLRQVQQVVTASLNYDVFSLTNSLAEGESGKALHVLENLIQEGPQQKAQAIQIIGALGSQIHSLLAVKIISGSASEKAKALGWKEGRVWINDRLSSKFSTPKLKQLLSDLKQIDLRAKTSDEPIKLLLSLFIQKAKV